MRICVLLFIVLLLSCDQRPDAAVTPIEHRHDDVTHSHSYKHEVQEHEKGRFAWQKPAQVINKLGDLSGKTVADIGAGTGYFTFRLIRKAEKVVAIDIDPEMIALIDLLKVNLDSIQQSRLETRLALPDDPKLGEEEVDVVLIINTIAYINDRDAYLNNLMRSLKEGGLIMIVDYKMKRIASEIAPPSTERLTMLEIEETLERVGYKNIVTDDISLEYQYMISARK